MGTVTALKGFYRPELSGYKKPVSKKRSASSRKKANYQKLKLKVLMHFKLHETATNTAICFCIHKETGWELPGRATLCRRFISKFARSKFLARKQPPKKADSIKDFYASKQWKELRFVALRMAEGRCGLCGGRACDGLQLHVDHIKPRSKFPELALDLDNLQILCGDCNIGKSNYDDTDYRSW